MNTYFDISIICTLKMQIVKQTISGYAEISGYDKKKIISEMSRVYQNTDGTAYAYKLSTSV